MKDIQNYVEKIRGNYAEKKADKLEELRALDKKARRPAKIFAYAFGAVGALVLGTGMCLAMKVIGDLFALGVVVGVVGIAMVSLTPLLYGAILKRGKRRYAEQVISLSDEILHKA